MSLALGAGRSSYAEPGAAGQALGEGSTWSSSGRGAGPVAQGPPHSPSGEPLAPRAPRRHALGLPVLLRDRTDLASPALDGVALLPQLLLALLLQATPVGAVELAEVGFSPRHDGPASVVARNQSALSAEIRAVVVAVKVDVGDQPASGDRLVELDCRPFRITERRLRAELDAKKSQAGLAERRVARARALRLSETVSVELLDSRESEHATLEAQVLATRAALDQAELDVERCSVRAPFAGVVSDRMAQVGQLTEPGAPLLTLVEFEGPQVAAQLSLDFAEELAGAEDLEFTWREGAAPVRVLHVLPIVDPKTRSREVRLEFSGADVAAPGTSGRLTWHPPGLAVPAHLLVRRGEALGLFLLSGSGDGLRARFHPIPGAVEGRPAFVDLPADTMLVTEGRLGLSDQDAVSLR